MPCWQIHLIKPFDNETQGPLSPWCNSGKSSSGVRSQISWTWVNKISFFQWSSLFHCIKLRASNNATSFCLQFHIYSSRTETSCTFFAQSRRKHQTSEKALLQALVRYILGKSYSMCVKFYVNLEGKFVPFKKLGWDLFAKSIREKLNSIIFNLEHKKGWEWVSVH